MKKIWSAVVIVSIFFTASPAQSIAKTTGDVFGTKFKTVASQFSVTNIVVVGTAKVGQSISVEDVTINPSWGDWDSRVYLDGTLVGGSTYTFKPGDFNKTVSISVNAHVPICCAIYINPPQSVTVYWGGRPVVQAGNFPSTPTPEISGSGQVGSYLNVDPGNWDSHASLAASWLRDGIAIPGENDTRYRIRPEDHGHTIAAQIRATGLGFLDATSKSEKIQVTKGDLGFESPPSVNGDFQVGSILRGSFSPSVVGATSSIEWLRNGIPIPGENSSLYRILGSDLKSTLALRISLSHSGYNQYSETTPGESVQLGVFLPKTKPAIKGLVKASKLVTVSCPLWKTGVKVSYDWYVDGKLFQRTSAGKIVVPNRVGRKLSVKVTQSLPGYRTVSATSSTSTIK